MNALFGLNLGLQKPEPKKKVIKPLDEPIVVSDDKGNTYKAMTLQSIDAVACDE